VLSKAAVFVLALLAVPALAEDAGTTLKKGKRPGLELRSTPRFAFSPARILFTAELKGGEDVEELYCPEVEWEWGDGGRSVEEADCDPWQPGSRIDRRFSAGHNYPQAGAYTVKITLRKSGKSMAAQSLRVTVRAGVGDSSPDPSID
jgi:hypothetical protein